MTNTQALEALRDKVAAELEDAPPSAWDQGFSAGLLEALSHIDALIAQSKPEMTDRLRQSNAQLDDTHELLKRWGFAPGDYHCLCSECGRGHTADKRAWRCLSCAEGHLDDARYTQADLDRVFDAALEAAADKLRVWGDMGGREIIRALKSDAALRAKITKGTTDGNS